MSLLVNIRFIILGEKMKVLIIIPAYNEEESIVRVTQEIIDCYPAYDYIIINDGSTDQTKEVCKNFHLINLAMNTGIGVVNQTGIKYASLNDYDCCITFDGDGQHQVRDIERLIHAIKNGAHIAIGSRYLKRRKIRNIRSIGSFLLSILIYMTTFKWITDPTSGLRAYNQETMRLYENEMNGTIEADELVYLLKKRYRIVEVPVVMKKRVAGLSYFNFFSSIKFMIQMTISILFVQIFRH